MTGPPTTETTTANPFNPHPHPPSHQCPVRTLKSTTTSLSQNNQENTKTPPPPDSLSQFSLNAAYAHGAVASGSNISYLMALGTYAFALSPTNDAIVLIDPRPYLFTETNNALTPFPDTPIAFAMTTLFVPGNRVILEPGSSVQTLRTTFAKGKRGYDGRNHPVPFAIRGAFSSVQTTKRGELRSVQGVVFGWMVPTWMEFIGGRGVWGVF